jgi:hypothetical protein
LAQREIDDDLGGNLGRSVNAKVFLVQTMKLDFVALAGWQATEEQLLQLHRSKAIRDVST